MSRAEEMRILALLTDGFGAQGGIARYNEAFLTSLVANACVEQVVALPRFGDAAGSPPPARVEQMPEERTKLGYLGALGRLLSRRRRFDLVFCGHLNLALPAAMGARLCGCPWWLQIHGIEAWAPRGPAIRRRALRPDIVTAVSRHTRRRFLAWAEIAPERVRVLPNTYRPSFTPGPRSPNLVSRYQLANRRVLLSIGRLDSRERYKGHDRVLTLLPELQARFPDILYLIVGDGDDRSRIEAVARSLGVADACRLVGWVPESELVDHMRLADLFVLPSTGEGFGIVFLEAMACGVPAVGCNVDGSVDALEGSGLGVAVAPEMLGLAIVDILTKPPSSRVPASLAERFGSCTFTAGVSAWLALLQDQVAGDPKSVASRSRNPAVSASDQACWHDHQARGCFEATVFGGTRSLQRSAWSPRSGNDRPPARDAEGCRSGSNGDSMIAEPPVRRKEQA